MAASGTSDVLPWLSGGSHTVILRVTDAAGNVATSSVTFTVRTDLIGGLGTLEVGGIAALIIVVAVVSAVLWRRRRTKPRPPEGPPPA